MTAVIFSLMVLLLSGCESREEQAKEHLQRGIELFNKGEYAKANLELKTSSQTGKDTAETYYYLALMDEKNKHFKNMRKNLIKALELAPDNNEVRLKLGKVELLFNETDNALNNAEKVLKKQPRNHQALALKATALIRQKKQQEALVIINGILREDPQYTDALSIKSLVYMNNGDFDKALVLIDKAIATDPGNISLHLFKVQLDAKSNNLKGVIEDYEKLVELYPDNVEFKVNLAKIYSKSGDTKKAEHLLRQLVNSDPNNVKLQIVLLEFLNATDQKRVRQQFRDFVEQHKQQPRMLLVLAKWMLGKDKVATKAVLHRIVDQEENTNVGLSAKILLAKIAFDTKDFAATQKMVDNILAANANYIDAQLLQARLLLVNKQYDKALELLKQVTWSQPDSDEALALTGEAYLLKGDKEQADKYFRLALEENPANIQALMPVFNKIVKANKIDQAKVLLQDALQRKPGNVGLLHKLAQLQLLQKDWQSAQKTIDRLGKQPGGNDLAAYLNAQSLQRQDHCAQAIEIYKKLLRKYPGHPNALTEMARCHEKLAKRDEMISYLNDILASDPDNLAVNILLSQLLVNKKDYQQASAILQRLIDKKADIPKLYIDLARVFLAQNDINGAKAVYQKGLQRMPKNVQLSLLLASLYEREQQYTDAAAIYETLLEENNNLDVAANNLASILTDHFNAESIDRAVQLSKRFEKSNQPFFQDTYAWALIKQDEVDKGLGMLKKIINTAPNVPVIRYHLGVAYYKNGNIGAAMSELNQALELAKQNPGVFGEKKEAEDLLAKIVQKRSGS